MPRSVDVRHRLPLWHGAKTYLIAWPIAAATGFLVFPPASGATENIIKRFG